MDQIFVVNPKGGCGKTTISTQLAGYYASQQKTVLIVDRDAQKSSSDWLRARAQQFSPIDIVSASADGDVCTDGYQVVIHDMPAAWPQEGAAQIIRPQDRVIIPVLASPNDIKACLRFVMGLSRSGVLAPGVQVGVVANRVRSQTNYFKILQEFIGRLGLDFVGVLRDTQNYIAVMDRGLSIFDRPSARFKADLEQWRMIVAWLAIPLKPKPAPQRQASSQEKLAEPA